MKRCVLMFALLAACTSPVEECITAAERDYEGLLAAISISEANLERGFAVSRDYVPSTSFGFCTGTRIGNHGFSGGLSACRSTQLKTITTPVPIDLEVEARKLQSMQARLTVAREQRNQRLGACFQAAG